MKFIAGSAPLGWRPRPGDFVEGISRGRIYRGIVCEGSRQGQPAVFSRHGFVGLFIYTQDGRRVAICEARPVM